MFTSDRYWYEDMTGGGQTIYNQMESFIILPGLTFFWWRKETTYVVKQESVCQTSYLSWSSQHPKPIPFQQLTKTVDGTNTVARNS